MRDLIMQLDAHAERPCISLYVPLVPGTARAEDNKERIHNALHSIEGNLAAYGLSPKGENQLLADARSFADEELVEQSGGGTMALFLAPSCFQHTLLPAETERTVIADNFFLLPLLTELIVAESWNGETILQASREGEGALIYDVADTVRAAEEGELETLLLAEGAEEWGVRDDVNGILALHQQQEAGDREWIGHTAACVLRSGGTIGFIPFERIPGGGKMAGVGKR